MTGTYPGDGQWNVSPPTCAHGMAWSYPCASCGRGYPSSAPTTLIFDQSVVLAALGRIEAALMREKDPATVTLPRLVYARLMHLAYAGANLLAEPNGQTDVEPYPVNKAWLDQIDKEAGNE